MAHQTDLHSGSEVQIVMSEEEKEALDVYHAAFNDDDVDYKLIHAIIEYIQTEFTVVQLIFI